MTAFRDHCVNYGLLEDLVSSTKVISVLVPFGPSDGHLNVGQFISGTI